MQRSLPRPFFFMNPHPLQCRCHIWMPPNINSIIKTIKWLNPPLLIWDYYVEFEWNQFPRLDKSMKQIFRYHRVTKGCTDGWSPSDREREKLGWADFKLRSARPSLPSSVAGACLMDGRGREGRKDDRVRRSNERCGILQPREREHCSGVSEGRGGEGRADRGWT